MRSGGGVCCVSLYTAAAPTHLSKHDELRPARKQLLCVHSAVKVYNTLRNKYCE